MAAKARPDEPTFESHLEALESVVADLEGDALSLEASIDRYKQGVAHLAACRRILDAAEQRLAELVQAPDGSLVEKPLAVGPDGLVDASTAPASAPTSAPGGAAAGKAPAPRPKRSPPPAAASGDDDVPF